MHGIGRLAWDDRIADHIARHDVTPEDLEQAVFDETAFAYRSRGRLVVLGQTLSGRYLTVILERLEDDVWLPITARDMSHAERARVARRRRGKGKR